MLLAATCMGSTTLSGCIYDDLSDCIAPQSIQFSYNRNMKFADAIGHEVKTVSVAAFRRDGTAVYVKSSSIEALRTNAYKMDVTDMPDGKLDIVAWAEGEIRNKDSYSPVEVKIGSTHIDQLTRKINRDADGIVNKDLTPLFHAMIEDADFTSEAKKHARTVSMDLTKNTNVVRVILQHLSGEEVDINKFTFRITDDNGLMNYDNALLPDEMLSYHPWATYSGSAGINRTRTDEAQTEVGVAVAEFTIGRLCTTHHPTLSVYNLEGKRVLSIPVTDYALLVKGNYHKDMTDQEYLDRQDEYNMTFFLDKEEKWVSSSIIINSWRVILSNVDIDS